MQFLVVAFCVALVVYAVITIVRSLMGMAKGECCQSCAGCANKGNCKGIASTSSKQGVCLEEEKKQQLPNSK